MWPWDWVIAAGSGIAGVSQAVANWVSQIIASVVSWFNDAITSIWNTIRNIGGEIAAIWDHVVSTIENAVSAVYDWINHLVQDVYNWATRVFGDVWNWIHGTWDWVTRQVSDLFQLIDHAISQITDWVNREIWQPLYHLYTGIRDYFTAWIARIWNYIEHPELLIDLIGRELWRLWTRYVARYGIALARWLLRQMFSLQGEVFDLLESILTSLL